MNKEIGGYLDWHLEEGKSYHEGALALNAGRFCMMYSVKARGYKHVYLPAFICDSIPKCLEEAGITISFYMLDEGLKPTLKKKMEKEEGMLIVNYWGMLDEELVDLQKQYGQIMVDNTQAFYQMPKEGTDTFYSPRKFFGVTDGGYVYCQAAYSEVLKRDESSGRYLYLLERMEKGAQHGFQHYQEVEKSLGKNTMQYMSYLTEKLLKNVPYTIYKNRREMNAHMLHEQLSDKQQWSHSCLKGLENMMNQGPMIYPLLTQDKGLKSRLIQQRIYIPTYWEDARKRIKKNSIEEMLLDCLVPLPVDQRYGREEMAWIIEKIGEGGMA